MAVWCCVCHSDELLRQLFNSIKHPLSDKSDGCLQDGDGDVLLDAAYDYDWLHEIGSGIDDCPLPHHISSTEEILDLLERVKSLISRLPRPSAVTIARLCFQFRCCLYLCIICSQSDLKYKLIFWVSMACTAPCELQELWFLLE